jgi:hypothetical protein
VSDLGRNEVFCWVVRTAAGNRIVGANWLADQARRVDEHNRAASERWQKQQRSRVVRRPLKG